jgi:predicted transcriptional regulator
MAKTRTTVTLDEETLRAVKIRAARTGKGESEVMEEAIRQSLGIGLLERQWAATGHLSEEESMGIALEAQREVRARRRPRG